MSFPKCSLRERTFDFTTGTEFVVIMLKPFFIMVVKEDLFPRDYPYQQELQHDIHPDNFSQKMGMFGILPDIKNCRSFS